MKDYQWLLLGVMAAWAAALTAFSLLVPPTSQKQKTENRPKAAARIFLWQAPMYLDSKGGFYFACAVMIAGGALAWWLVLLPLAKAFGLF